MNDAVTHASAEIELTVDQPLAAMWERITDVTRIGDWSPECVSGAWLGASDPLVGAHFTGHNRFPNGFEGDVECVVTAAEPAYIFEWVVLDESGSVDRPSSTWRYELTPGPTPEQTVVRQRFEHGAGNSGVRAGVEQNPANAEAIVAARLDQLRHNMTVTIQAMVNEGASL